jgi:hypothetical protein
VLVNRVKLAALDGIEEDIRGLLDALEEGIVLGPSGCGLLVWVMLEDLLAVGALDLVLCRSKSVLGQSKDSVVILSLG